MIATSTPSSSFTVAEGNPRNVVADDAPNIAPRFAELDMPQLGPNPSWMEHEARLMVDLRVQFRHEPRRY